MSAIKQIQIGGGTTYDVNDLRVATSVVTTATHVLATNSAVSAINPIAMASLASVLGGQIIRGSQYSTFASAPYGVYGIYGFNEFSDSPITVGTSGIMIKTDCGSGFYSITLIETQADHRVFVKYSYSDAWYEVTVPSFYKDYSTLASLASALGGESPISITKNSVELAAGATSSAINTGSGIVIVSSSGTENVKVAVVGNGGVDELNDYSGITIATGGGTTITIKNNLSSSATFYYKMIGK